MGQRGSAPLPDWYKKLRGNPGKRKLASDTGTPMPDPVVELPAPAHFNDEQREVWEKVCGLLAEVKALTKADQFPLARYVELTWQYQRAQEFMSGREGGELTYTVRGKDGEVKAIRTIPELDAMLRISSHLLKIEQQFGLTPSARAGWMNKPSGGNGGGSEPDPFD